MKTLKKLEKMKFNNKKLRESVEEWLVDEKLAELKYGHISEWDVSNVTNMSNLFSRCSEFNEDLSKWETTKVKNFSGMFQRAELFNQDINCWDVSNATKMVNVFEGAISFNQPLNKWNVSNVKSMENMFSDAESFNQDIRNWNVSNVTNMKGLFGGAESFNQDIRNWNVANVTNMWAMFSGAISFNQPLNKWDVSKVKTMQAMFANAKSFNQDISSWDISNVRNMSFMFNDAKSFNQDISNWDTRKVVYKMDEGLFNFYNKPSQTNKVEDNSLVKVDWLNINESIYIDTGDTNLQMNSLYYDEINQEIFSIVSSKEAAEEIINSIIDTIRGDFIKLETKELDKFSSPVKTCLEIYEGNDIRFEIVRTAFSIQLLILQVNQKEIVKTFYDDGSLETEYQINNQEINGYYKIYHENGQLKVESSWTNGVQDDGTITSYHDDGSKAREVTLVNHLMNGDYFEWYKNGQLKTQGTYKDKNPTILKEWDENGILIDKVNDDR